MIGKGKGERGKERERGKGEVEEEMRDWEGWGRWKEAELGKLHSRSNFHLFNLLIGSKLALKVIRCYPSLGYKG